MNILVLGDNSQRYSAFGRTCGENCDRDNIDLPGRQQELLEAVAASGRPTVLILMSGRALGVHWAAENPSVNAILEAWEPGQMGGQAIAEVLFGLVNPSGKLPVTIPRNAGQIQCVYNHKHSQYSRQFALAEQGPLYPFGYGLSYTEFEYGEPVLSKNEIGAKESVKLSDYSHTILKHEPIAKTGNSGSVKDEKTLGFQIIDVKEKKAINPLILLPQPNQLPQLSISNIIIKNKNGVAYEMQYAKAFMAGNYKIYFKRNDLAVPFKTSILVNGEQTDEISYNSLNQEDGKCTVTGKRNYSNSEVYPDEKLMLIGEAVLKQGKATISLIFTDLKGSTRQLNYNVTVH